MKMEKIKCKRCGSYNVLRKKILQTNDKIVNLALCLDCGQRPYKVFDEKYFKWVRVKESNSRARNSSRQYTDEERIKLRKFREILYKRDGKQCKKCGKVEAVMHMDHIRPYEWGGKFTLKNFQVLCRMCNSFKGDACVAY